MSSFSSFVIFLKYLPFLLILFILPHLFDLSFNHHFSLCLTNIYIDVTTCHVAEILGNLLCLLEEVTHLGNWWQENLYLSVNVSKTKELIVDFGIKQGRSTMSLRINGAPVESVDSFRYLCIFITENLSWSSRVDTLVKKVHQGFYKFRRLRDFWLPLRC